MTLVRYRPLRDMLTVQDEVNRMIDSFFRPAATEASGGWAPACDVRETETDFVVRAELPGVAKDEIKVNLVNNTLTIRGEKKEENEEKKGNWHRVERTFGAFERALTFPANVQAEQIKARYTNGVLEVTVPKAESARTREIKIEL